MDRFDYVFAVIISIGPTSSLLTFAINWSRRNIHRSVSTVMFFIRVFLTDCLPVVMQCQASLPVIQLRLFPSITPCHTTVSLPLHRSLSYNCVSSSPSLPVIQLCLFLSITPCHTTVSLPLHRSLSYNCVYSSPSLPVIQLCLFLSIAPCHTTVSLPLHHSLSYNCVSSSPSLPVI